MGVDSLHIFPWTLGKTSYLSRGGQSRAETNDEKQTTGQKERKPTKAASFSLAVGGIPLLLSITASTAIGIAPAYLQLFAVFVLSCSWTGNFQMVCFSANLSHKCHHGVFSYVCSVCYLKAVCRQLQRGFPQAGDGSEGSAGPVGGPGRLSER